jgi:pimeloyl-ACP methyl ester carboxylesterase
LTQQIPVVEAFKPGDETASEDMETLALLERLSMPLSIIYGDNTMPVLKQVVQGLKARLPHAEVVEVKRASHMLPLTHANDVTEQLRSLWTA